MSWLASDAATVRKLVVKDWQVYQRQLAGYLAGMLVALGLIATGSSMASAAGALLLLVLLVVVGSYAINSSIMAERKQQTVPFIMSLPVTPMDVFWGKLLANLAIYLVPFLVVTGGVLALVLSKPIPDGVVPWVAVVAGFMLVVFCVSLCLAIAVDSEGWNVFGMLVMMTGIGPFIYWVGRMEGIAAHMRADEVVWNVTSFGLLSVEVAVVATAVLVTSWVHARKRSFL
jgi:ABC-type transport system involved in multi-copper enzyme maturation permease subunit